MGYGTGAIFGCPAHDQRDLDFAHAYDLPVLPGGGAAQIRILASFTVGDEAYTGPGALANSAFLDGLDVDAAKREIIARLEDMGQGEGADNYRLRGLAGLPAALLGAARSR